jgi:endonuclease/exonuclease/phosphatase family metal-dependent hydrolase
MSKNNHGDLDPRIKGEVDPFSKLWLRLEAATQKIGSNRLSRLADKLISVAEPAGRTFMSTIPHLGYDKERRPLVVLSANLWHDWPRFRSIEKRLGYLAGLVEQEKVDVILLQEIARTPFLKVDKWLAERLNMSYVYSRANGSEHIGFEEGLGVFSRFQMKRFPFVRQVSRLTNPFVRRLALGVEVDTPYGEILAFSVHLGILRKQNAHQLNELQLWISRLADGRSIIIGGDFNVTEKSRQMRKVRRFWLDTFRETQFNSRSYTHTLKWPWGGKLFTQRIDYIFLQQGKPAWKVISVDHLDAPGGSHSDHRAVVARFAPAFAQERNPEY